MASGELFVIALKPMKLLIFFFSLIVLLTGCGENNNLTNNSVSYWVNDKDSCISGMPQAIVDSGQPYPNFIYETITNPKTGKEERKLKAYDLWLGKERYRIPAKYLVRNYSYPEKHPYRYMGLNGSLPNFYPKGPRAEVKDGMGAMVRIRFGCSMEESYEKTIGWQSNEEGITHYTKQMQKRASHWNSRPDRSHAKVSVQIREDLQMTEVLWDTKSIKNEGGGYRWLAAYWPLDREMKGLAGSVSGITCETRHDPIQKRYVKRGWPCTSALRVNKNVTAKIQVYISHIEAMPSIHQQVKQLLIDSKIQE